MSRPGTRWRAMNQSRETVVAETVTKADHYWSRMMGLMGKPGLPEGHGLWIVPCNQVHSCFMRFQFDAIFVDRAGTVLHLEEAMRPWGFSRLVWKGHAVLELEAGAIARSQTRLGDQVVLLEATPDA